jgi:hypothetical protein
VGGSELCGYEELHALRYVAFPLSISVRALHALANSNSRSPGLNRAKSCEPCSRFGYKLP